MRLHWKLRKIQWKLFRIARFTKKVKIDPKKFLIRHQLHPADHEWQRHAGALICNQEKFAKTLWAGGPALGILGWDPPKQVVGDFVGVNPMRHIAPSMPSPLGATSLHNPVFSFALFLSLSLVPCLYCTDTHTHTHSNTRTYSYTLYLKRPQPWPCFRRNIYDAENEDPPRCNFAAPHWNIRPSSISQN